ncbi:ankyrin repeat domain-containing protein [Hirsutella rhossiliensis]|uniref:Ankyrin repeat domain-containing protein n=1 Tax=Hirsutella rhossiliensis TaxID=111463 RepID=A0A9P8N449_9HYPO|nr:ankyrin repeat domain-containing protein [Hirsutella rhossiliensis]KAH0966474.1 ankyrin repeat domain-containing protein [Hirsutella rhossiliensis]
MTKARASGAASPLIAGAATRTATSSGEFGDFDDDFGAPNLFDFSTSPDTLQRLETIGTSDPKTFLSPQDLTLPDSPTSYQDSSSDSASSSKRTESSASAIPSATPADIAMEQADDVKMEWGHSEYTSFDDDDHAFTFARDADPSAAMGGIYGFGENEDTFMDRSFDFSGASNSPDGPSHRPLASGPIDMPSPGMPTIKTNSPRKPNQAQRSQATGHRKQISQYSMAFSAHGVHSAGSREVSPMSAMVTSHDSSPAATFFNSPSPATGHDFSNGLNRNAMWTSRMDVPPRPDAIPASAQLAAPPMAQPAPAPQFPLSPPPLPVTGGYELTIMPTPLKSRVETQIPIKMTLSPLPPGVTKLHLPAHTISKPKLLAKPPPERSPDMLELFVTLVCTSAMEQPELKQQALERATSLPQRYLPERDDEESSPQNGGDVRICPGCVTRERKRAARKKIKKPDEEKLWALDEDYRVIVFNTTEVKEWQQVLDSSGRPEKAASGHIMQIDAPMRIACYCRHHNEKMGFNVIFTIKDFRGQVIAQAMSNPVMITDDHKTHPVAQSSSQAAMSESVTSSTVPASTGPSPPAAAETNGLMHTAQNGAFRMSNGDPASSHGSGRQASHPSSASGKTTPTMGTVTVPTRAMSRPASPIQGGPMAKKRKSSGSTSSRVPNGLTMTRLETSPSPNAHNGTQLSTATSPFSPNSAHFSQLEPMFGQHGGQHPFANGPPTPGGNEQAPFYAGNRSASMDNLAVAHLYSAPTSSHPSRAPSPSGLRNGIGATQGQFAPSLVGNLFSMPMGVNQACAPPTIHKVIPNEGSKMGGAEVTVLGQAFFQGLEVYFGDQKATTTTFWGESSLVCLLPPSPVAGAVAVTFKQQGVAGAQGFSMAKEPPIFKYIEDNENSIIRTALSVLGQKMSGQIMDVSDLARRILNDGNPSWSGGSSVAPGAGGAGFNQASHGQHLESQLLKCLDLIDLGDSTHRTRLDWRRPTGHTMLHLACSLGYHRFVAALLARGANYDARDRGGFTPLHMAAMHGHAEIVRRLMLHGADPTIRSLSGLVIADMTNSRSVLRAMCQPQRHARSFSGSSSLHSRASSSASLRSLWEPLTRAHTYDEPIPADPGDESPEYTSGDLEDEDPDEDRNLHMRRHSRVHSRVHSRARQDIGIDSLGDGPDASAGALASPTTQFAAIKDQLQQQLHQFQQSMALHLQSLPQMPQMPTLPGMPMLPDYQAYLPQSPFMRRMQQLMPGSGPRPDSRDGEGDTSKLDARWWDITSYMQNSAAPPSYEDIFGRQDTTDPKQESAIRAATEAEADMKCAALYDQPSPPSGSGSRTQAQGSSPGVLKIGRKNAITKEQQEQFLLAHERRLKKLSSDRNLFFIWIPLLVVMVCAMLCSYFPSLFPFLWTSVRALVQAGQTRASRAAQDAPRVVEA